MKKRFLSLLLFSSILYADPADNNEITQEEPLKEEIIASLDAPTFSQEAFLPSKTESPPPKIELKHKSSFTAVSLSFLIPGLGHVYLNDLTTAGGLAASYGLCLASLEKNKDGNEVPSATGLLNTWFYGVYSAYRDVRIYNSQKGYKYPMPTDSLSDLAKAPFQLSVITKPAVWGGVAGLLAAGATITYFAFPENESTATCSTSDNTVNPLLAFPIGIGEEAFFRGYLQSHLTELSNPTTGIVLSSLIFGAMHIPNALAFPEKDRASYYTYSIPLITSIGGYLGWLTHKTNSLKQGTAVHAWYDFTLFAITAAATSKASIVKPSFAYSFSF